MSKPPKGEKLTAKQRRWCELVLEGKSDMEAYRIAYGVPLEEAGSNAYRLRKNDGVMMELQRMREESFKYRRLSREEKEAILCDIARDAEKETDRVRAINEHNRMTGEHSATKVEVNDVGSVLEMIRSKGERATP